MFTLESSVRTKFRTTHLFRETNRTVPSRQERPRYEDRSGSSTKEGGTTRDLHPSDLRRATSIPSEDEDVNTGRLAVGGPSLVSLLMTLASQAQ